MSSSGKLIIFTSFISSLDYCRNKASWWRERLIQHTSKGRYAGRMTKLPFHSIPLWGEALDAETLCTTADKCIACLCMHTGVLGREGQTHVIVSVQVHWIFISVADACGLISVRTSGKTCLLPCLKAKVLLIVGQIQCMCSAKVLCQRGWDVTRCKEIREVAHVHACKNKPGTCPVLLKVLLPLTLTASHKTI